MRLHPFRALVPRLSSLIASGEFFSSEEEEWRELWGSGLFQPAALPDLYIYRIEDGHRSYQGLIGATDIADYLEGRIRIHEQTLPSREHVHRELLRRRHVAIKPVLLTYSDGPELSGATQGVAAGPADIRINWNGEIHALWSVARAGQLDALLASFREGVARSYVADGHHRSACQAQLFRSFSGPPALNPYRFLFTAYFPASQLEVHEFNRLLRLPDASTLERLWTRLRACGRLEPLPGPQRPGRKHELTVLRGDAWYRLRWDPGWLRQATDGAQAFDSQLLDDRVIRETLEGLEYELRYVEGPRGLDSLRAGLYPPQTGLAFILPPVPLEEVMAVADQGQTLPPKSTWFLPRMKNGLVGMELAPATTAGPGE